MSELRWTAQQARAIAATGTTLLEANAGTGKTATVIGKIQWLLGLDLPPDGAGEPLPPCSEPCALHEIAAITFTEKAAYDLKRKLRDMIEESERADELRWEIDRASIGTIHSFCAELLRDHALRLGIDPTFGVLDSRESWAVQDDIIREVIYEALEAEDPGTSDLLRVHKLSGWQHTNGAIDHVRTLMNDLRWHGDRYTSWEQDGRFDRQTLSDLAGIWDDDADEVVLRHCDALLRLATDALERWQRYLASENVRDFDSLILDARTLLTGDDGMAALESIRRRYRILIIDELQDTDVAQRDIAFAIAGLDRGRAVPRPQLFLVGDPKQSIYRFRGADISVWNGVQEAVRADGKVMQLSENFRCAPPIIGLVNGAAAAALADVGAALEDESPASVIAYSELVAARQETPTARLEWLVAEKAGGRAKNDPQAEAAQVAARIDEMVGIETVLEGGPETERPIGYRDIAVLYRSRSALRHFEASLGRRGIPYTIAGAPHLGDRQEILDLLNALRLIRNPHDDLRAFGFLRSPFVCLRDEVIAHIRLQTRGPDLLGQCEQYLRREEWYEAPEHGQISSIERQALERGLQSLRQARALVHRAPLDEVLSRLLDDTGYRLHLHMRQRREEPLANIQSFIQFTEAYRDLDIGTFLEVWDRWDEQDNGLPQAPLYSNEDDVVTLTTIHRAKGLEWPVVFLVGIGRKLGRDPWGRFWSDRELGPLLNPPRSDRGARAQRLHDRERLEDRAEEARLLYVATTRARDRLLLVGARDDNSYATWLQRGIDRSPVFVREEPAIEPDPDQAATVGLDWLDGLRIEKPGRLVSAIVEPPLRFVHSATELMTRQRDEAEWERRYRHGVEAPGEFVKRPAGGEPALQATVRGTLIHGVLERIEREDELAAILEETIGSLDDPELERLMSAHSRYREALEAEIRRIVRSDAWKWYVEGENYRELSFLHLLGPLDWRVGAFDLYRPGDPETWVVDFKTHEIEAAEVAAIAAGYRIQAQVYRQAARVAGPARVRLHFTGPDELVDDLGLEPSAAGSADGQPSGGDLLERESGGAEPADGGRDQGTLF
ncbi:MAG TPA: UvrD-helicase domain-containing protein [Acidobacteriota bacterium]|nr:UvrD-helicase domain-containing protein [Acidobacteriota bacterium]